MSSYMSLIKPDGMNISPQLKLAAFQYLSTSIEQFHSKHISKTILERLLNQHLFNEIKLRKKDKGKHDPNSILYEKVLFWFRNNKLLFRNVFDFNI